MENYLEMIILNGGKQMRGLLNWAKITLNKLKLYIYNKYFKPTHYIGVDVGYHDPTSFVVIAKEYDGKYQIVNLKNTDNRMSKDELNHILNELMYQYKVTEDRVFTDLPYGYEREMFFKGYKQKPYFETKKAWF